MPPVVFLPATEPGDATYGHPPERLDIGRDVTCHALRYPRLVWYNAAVRKEAVRQIEALDLRDIILVGFSKSALGAWNIARMIPDRVAATILFDAPVARRSLPPWQTAPFYADDDAWGRDLPLNTVPAFKAALPPPHTLVLISGKAFADEMRLLSQTLDAAAVPHVLLDRPLMPHHWRSGWLEKGLRSLPKSV